MAKRSISANAENIGNGDKKASEGGVKYISDFSDYSFLMKAYDEDGKQTFHSDANGNGRLPDIKEYHFAPIRAVKNPATGQIDPNTAYSIFIVDPKVHGKDFDRIIDRLEALRKDPFQKLYTADDHFARRNREAFNIAKRSEELEEKLSEKDARIKELEAKLGFAKKA
jgi:hypothetical protein